MVQWRLSYFVSTEKAAPGSHVRLTPISTATLNSQHRLSAAPPDLVKKFGTERAAEFEDEVADALEEGAGEDPCYLRFYGEKNLLKHTIFWWVTPTVPVE